MAEIPHLAFPFRFKTQPGGTPAAAVTEQHSQEEIIDCITVLVLTPLGHRDELPEFGTTPQVFHEAPLDVEQVLGEISAWESRADLSGLTYVDSLDELVQHLRLNVGVAELGEED